MTFTKKNLFLLILSFALTFLPHFAHAQVSSQQNAPTAGINAGFVEGIWYSKMPFFTGETVRIYTAFQNQSNQDMSGKIEFYDGNTLIGGRDFTAVSGQLIQNWIDWKVTFGEHSITVKLNSIQSSVVGEDPKPVKLVKEVLTAENSVFADLDTDGDGTGNMVDIDDDGDNLLDTVDPLPLIKNVETPPTPPNPTNPQLPPNPWTPDNKPTIIDKGDEVVANVSDAVLEKVPVSASAKNATRSFFKSIDLNTKKLGSSLHAIKSKTQLEIDALSGKKSSSATSANTKSSSSSASGRSADNTSGSSSSISGNQLGGLGGSSGSTSSTKVSKKNVTTVKSDSSGGILWKVWLYFKLIFTTIFAFIFWYTIFFYFFLFLIIYICWRILKILFY